MNDTVIATFVMRTYYIGLLLFMAWPAEAAITTLATADQDMNNHSSFANGNWYTDYAGTTESRSI